MSKIIRTSILLMIVATFAFGTVACMTHEHIVGTGASTGFTETRKQWYAIYGLIPLGIVDTKAMSGGVEDYKIVTEISIIDALINGLTGGLINARTVSVIK